MKFREWLKEKGFKSIVTKNITTDGKDAYKLGDKMILFYNVDADEIGYGDDLRDWSDKKQKYYEISDMDLLKNNKVKITYEI